MDPSLFQFRINEVLDPPKPFGISEARAKTGSALHAGRPGHMEELTANSRNLDPVRSAAAIPVMGFSLAKFVNWRFKKL